MSAGDRSGLLVNAALDYVGEGGHSASAIKLSFDFHNPAPDPTWIYVVFFLYALGRILLPRLWGTYPNPATPPPFP